jgi:hypothetical protein
LLEFADPHQLLNLGLLDVCLFMVSYLLKYCSVALCRSSLTKLPLRLVLSKLVLIRRPLLVAYRRLTARHLSFAVTLLPPRVASCGVESGTLESGLEFAQSSPAGRYTLFHALYVLLTFVQYCKDIRFDHQNQ